MSINSGYYILTLSKRDHRPSSLRINDVNGKVLLYVLNWRGSIIVAARVEAGDVFMAESFRNWSLYKMSVCRVLCNVYGVT